MIELTNDCPKYFLTFLSEIISNNFKPIKNLTIKKNYFDDGVYHGENFVKYDGYNGKKIIHEIKRLILDIFIEFRDNTAVKFKVSPTEYLSSIKEYTSETVVYESRSSFFFSPFITIKDSYKELKKDIDYNKLGNIIIKKLKNILKSPTPTSSQSGE